MSKKLIGKPNKILFAESIKDKNKLNLKWLIPTNQN